MFKNKKTVIVEIGWESSKILEMGSPREGKGQMARVHGLPVKEMGEKEVESVCSYLLHHYVRQETQIELLLPFTQGYFHSFSLPWIPRRDRETAFGFLIDEEVPLPAEDRIADLTVVAEQKKKNMLKIAIGAAKKSWIGQYAQGFAAAGIKVKGIDFAVSSFGCALKEAGLDNVLYIDNDGQNLNVMLYREGTPNLIRAFPLKPLAEAPDQAGHWAAETAKTLMRSGYGFGTASFQVLTGSDQVSADLATALMTAGRFIPTEKAVRTRIWSKLQSEERPFEELALFGHAYRLKAQKPHFNFYRPDNKERGAGEKKKVKFGLVMGAVLIVLFLAAGAAERCFPHRAEEKITAADNGPRPAADDRQLSQSKQDYRLLTASAGEKTLQLIAALSDTVNLTKIELSDSGLAVSGEAPTGSGVYQVMKGIERLGWGTPELSEYAQDEAGRISFSCAAQEREKSGAEAKAVGAETADLETRGFKASRKGELPLVFDQCRQVFIDRGVAVTGFGIDSGSKDGSGDSGGDGHVLVRMDWQGSWQSIGAGLDYLEKEKGVGIRELELAPNGGQGILWIDFSS